VYKDIDKLERYREVHWYFEIMLKTKENYNEGFSVLKYLNVDQ